MSTIRHLFWDFDGTLYNSYPLLHHSFRSGLNAMGLGQLVTDEALMKLIKVSVFHAATWCAEQSGVDVQEIMASYRGFHKLEKKFPAYDGLADCLRRLHAAGYRHYLYTHRDGAAIVQLKADGLWELFEDAVISTDGFPSKPAPDALMALMARNQLTPDVCAMVGDRDIDIEAGHNAGMSGYLFDPEGFYPGYPAELHASTLTELADKLIP